MEEGQGDVPEKIELETKGENQDQKEESKKDKKKKEKKEKVKKEAAKRSLEACTQNFTVGLNVLDRDEKHINQHVNIHFEDVIAEPDPTHGFEFVWRLTYVLFNATRFWAYRFIAAVLAIPLALLWAIVFAVVNIGSIWFFTPLFRLFDIVIHHLHRVWSGLVRAFLDPFFNSAALLFTAIRTRRENVVVSA